MKRIIMYLEDDLGFLDHTIGLFKEEGYDVKGFIRIDLAKAFLLKNIDEIACVIVDLNMDGQWLEDYRRETNGDMISGWVFLRRFVYPIAPNMPSIIYSGYIDQLDSWHRREGDLNSFEFKSELMKKGIVKYINKGAGASEGFKAMVEALNDFNIPRKY